MQGPEATIAELSSRLEKAEAALQRSQHLVVASRYAGAIMHEVNNPLESLINLVYLTKHTAQDAASVVANMEIAESQLLLLEQKRNIIASLNDLLSVACCGFDSLLKDLLPEASLRSRQPVKIRNLFTSQTYERIAETQCMIQKRKRMVLGQGRQPER